MGSGWSLGSSSSGSGVNRRGDYYYIDVDFIYCSLNFLSVIDLLDVLGFGSLESWSEIWGWNLDVFVRNFESYGILWSRGNIFSRFGCLRLKNMKVLKCDENILVELEFLWFLIC